MLVAAAGNTALQSVMPAIGREIGSERDKAVVQLRREAIDLALAGASKVIEQNLESDKNRKLVESYLASIGSLEVSK